MTYKLVIWDLDETFWKGTLSEDKVEQIPENIMLLKAFVDRGIMNSIVSKNDYEKAMTILRLWKVDQYFIFPQISWKPKGKQVTEILQKSNLRAENTLFIDDNLFNLEEVKFYNPGITCVFPIYLLEKDILQLEEFKGKDDRIHTRLKQYKILENRIEEKDKYYSNEEFLRASNIEISIKTDCLSEIDRICELIQRTNQLNYTKNRMDKITLKNLLQKSEIKAAYVTAKDNFGDYGIIGFYLLQDENLVHFLFSCRILGFCIENYLYAKLGFPMIQIKGDVAAELKRENLIDWITESNDYLDEYSRAQIINIEKKTSKRKFQRKESYKKPTMLMIGGCDLESASRYLETDFEIRKEFNTVVNGHEIRTSDTYQLIYTKELNVSLQNELCKNIPFMHQEITYGTDLYSGEYKVIIISLVDDFIRGLYKRKDSFYYVTFGSYWNHEDDLESHFTEDEIKYFCENFIFCGKVTLQGFKENLRKIIEGVGESKLILINGIELDVSDWIGEERCQRNIEMNAVIDEMITAYPEIGLIDMRKIITSRKQLSQQDNRHFDRKSYYYVAQEIMQQSMSYLGDEKIKLKSIAHVTSEEFQKKIKRKILGGGLEAFRKKLRQ